MDDDTQIARWRQLCPDLFDKCGAAEISDTVVLNKLQNYEDGILKSFEAVESEIFEEHKERQRLKQVLQSRQQQQAEAEELEQPSETRQQQQAETRQQQQAEAEELERLPAWVCVRSELEERCELVSHALLSSCARMAPRQTEAHPEVEQSVRKAVPLELASLETSVMGLVYGLEGSAADVLSERLSKELGPLCESACEALSSIAVGSLLTLCETKAEELRTHLAEAAMEALRFGHLDADVDLGAALGALVAGAVVLPCDADGCGAARGGRRGRTPTDADSLLQHFECAICRDPFNSPVTLSCGHTFCKACLEETRKTHSRECPSCRALTTVARFEKVNRTQQQLITQLQKAQKRNAPVDLEALRAGLSCGACKHVLLAPVSIPGGQTRLCRCCFDLLAQGDGRELAPYIPDEPLFKFVMNQRAKLAPDVALVNAIEALFSHDAMRVPEAVRRRVLRGEPLDGRKRLKLRWDGAFGARGERKPRAERKPEKSWEERQEEKRQKEAAKMEEYKRRNEEEGKDYYLGNRVPVGMPDITHLLDNKGHPLLRNTSCHICSQGEASWKGKLFQPIGCSSCTAIFCPRCLGNIMGKRYCQDEADRQFVDAFIKEHAQSFECVICRGVCACQSASLAAVGIERMTATRTTEPLIITTAEAHPFVTEESLSIKLRGVPVTVEGVDDEAVQKKLEKAVNGDHKVTVLGPRSFSIQLDESKVAKAIGQEAPADKGKGKGKGGGWVLTGGVGGTAELAHNIDKHKKWGWAGVTGCGARAAASGKAGKATKRPVVLLEQAHQQAAKKAAVAAPAAGKKRERDDEGIDSKAPPVAAKAPAAKPPAARAPAAAAAAAAGAPSSSSPASGLPPGWRREERAAKARSYSVYIGPQGQQAQSRPDAWRVHNAAKPVTAPAAAPPAPAPVVAPAAALAAAPAAKPVAKPTAKPAAKLAAAKPAAKPAAAPAGAAARAAPAAAKAKKKEAAGSSASHAAVHVGFAVGDSVDGKWADNGPGGRGAQLDDWYPAKVVTVHADGTFALEYEDGDEARAAPAKFVRFARVE